MATAEQLAEALQACRRLVILTGAGISAESGIATFRGADGYWQRYRAQDLASPQGFAQNPERVWRWYDARRRAILEAEPNPGHRALATLAELFPGSTLITQNVDELHQRAGSRQPIEIHGSIWRLRCTRSGQEWPDRRLFEDFPPRCRCGALLRPAVLWFGESYDAERMHSAQTAVAAADAVLTIGTSGQVWIVAGLLAQARRALLAEFNLETTDTGQNADFMILGPAGEQLPRLVSRLQQLRAPES